MPPQKKDKKKHYRGKQFSQFEEDERDNVVKRNQRRAQDGGESSSSDGEGVDEREKALAELSKDVKAKTDGEEQNAPIFQRQRLNQGMNPDDATVASQGLTRKQREEIEKEQKRKRYEKLHREGKTDEAKSDLARLAKIKAEREEAKKKRDDQIAKEEAEKAEKTKGGNQKSAYVAALGGARVRKLEERRRRVVTAMMEATTRRARRLDLLAALPGEVQVLQQGLPRRECIRTTIWECTAFSMGQRRRSRCKRKTWSLARSKRVERRKTILCKTFRSKSVRWGGIRGVEEKW